MSSILDLVDRHDKFRASALNLQASENVVSPNVRKAMSSDLISRYSLEQDGDDAYGGTRFAREILHQVEGEVSSLFGFRFAEVRPIGGHIAAEIALLATVRRRENIMAIYEEDGGYTGYVRGFLPDILGFQSYRIPYSRERQEIDYTALEKSVSNISPRAIVLGQSFFVRPYDLKRVREIADRSGSLVIYDGSHVMGLIAGGEFQPDVSRYCDILLGSTHKTFFGPQGGVILTNDEDVFENVRANVTWRTMDNYHPNRVAALGVAVEEMKRHGKEYARKVVANARKMASELSERGFTVKYAPWFTSSHQVILDRDPAYVKGGSCVRVSRVLEENMIIIDREARVGLSEVTRMGLSDMGEIAELMQRAVEGQDVRKEVSEVVAKEKMQFW
ncbi:aminotransferase class I/II-fold pyridoxal phosphate-dependent enzyme [Thermogymnomonas acidicola]|nr:aminotransferase class I/II-fold pyridoxal phosphate-dependent enzyme [Thermogymnomonas acidicola]